MGHELSPLQALLVDLDGTLVETAAANHAAYAQALAEEGVQVARADFDAVAAGRNWRQFLPALLGAKAARAPDVAARKAALYGAYMGLTVPNAALIRLIGHFRADGAGKVALVSTASRANIERILGHHGLADLFDLVVSGNDVTRHKPDPEAYHLAAARLGVRPAQCLIFEDSEIGLAAAAAFGAPCLRTLAPAAPPSVVPSSVSD
ncbi:HAD family hydrolase [Phaeovulum vinaykumarii]|uniref:Haloacid dehalogenase superfamily, subfamily IA, variant 3 with third motif having DD or ED n=1 Tax=Phaeovulum vinaykumarii TaxID=407234 RepID=A0A1N7JUG7_9RHOB|nr:HAD family phosphatase [Phaeovulum vinaykumarii]SIS52876.1 haloacid dehalogenase superfamily, subfamily IA, variant 3 with third motif having DD or ED [Phaeovulum vinaykumarii]SOB91407.1 HAD superfamily hydrolase (TIGR01509 family) [Phaeovulum vinaykumarii]